MVLVSVSSQKEVKREGRLAWSCQDSRLGEARSATAHEPLVGSGGLLTRSVCPSGPSLLTVCLECLVEVTGSCSGDGQ